MSTHLLVVIVVVAASSPELSEWASIHNGLRFTVLRVMGRQVPRAHERGDP